MREQRVVVGIRHYKDDDPNTFDVEVFADNPLGQQYQKNFESADSGLVDFVKFYENNRIEGMEFHYEVDGSEVTELEAVPGGYTITAEQELKWLVTEADSSELWLVVLTARKILEAHPDWTPEQAIHVATIFERG